MRVGVERPRTVQREVRQKIRREIREIKKLVENMPSDPASKKIIDNDCAAPQNEKVETQSKKIDSLGEFPTDTRRSKVTIVRR